MLIRYIANNNGLNHFIVDNIPSNFRSFLENDDDVPVTLNVVILVSDDSGEIIWGIIGEVFFRRYLFISKCNKL